MQLRGAIGKVSISQIIIIESESSITYVVKLYFPWPINFAVICQLSIRTLGALDLVPVQV